MTKTQGEMLNLIVLREGSLAIQVCTNAKRKKDIERLANEASICGTVNGWVVDEQAMDQ